jgi:hypothetical protein
MFALILALACSQPTDTAGEDAPQAPAYRQVMATVGEDGQVDLYGIGLVYVPMLCPAGDLGVCYPAERGPDFNMRGGVLRLSGAPGDVFVVGHFAE